MSDDDRYEYGPPPAEPLRDAIDLALRAHAPYLGGHPAIPTGYVLMTQWMSADGRQWLSRSHPEHMPGWLVKGMLHEGLHDWPTATAPD